MEPQELTCTVRRWDTKGRKQVREAVTLSKFEPLGWRIFLAAHIIFYFLLYTWQIFGCVQLNGDQARCLGVYCNKRESGKSLDKIEKTNV